MARRGFCVKIQLDLHAITCPGVWLCPNGKTALQINTFNSTIESRRIPPVFPLLFHDRFSFNGVFTRVATLAELQDCLEQEFVYAELIQWATPDRRKIVLATFETNLVDLLYPAPCFKGLLAGVDVDLLMEPTKHFPGIIAPKIEISTRTTVEEVSGVFDDAMNATYVVNPKTINSKNLTCCHKRSPVKGIIRQRKVCHSQGIPKLQTCRPYCQKPSAVKPSHLCSLCSERHKDSRFDKCYHERQKRENCFNEVRSATKIPNAIDACDNLHIFDNCLVCSKYKCYFSGHCDAENVARKQNLKHSESVRRNYVTGHDQDSAVEKKLRCFCRPNSAPNPQNNSLSVLRSRIRNLQKCTNRLHQTESGRKIDDVSECSPCQCEHDRDSTRQCFYKNLEKFYKRMYKQAKKRAQDSNV